MEKKYVRLRMGQVLNMPKDTGKDGIPVKIVNMRIQPFSEGGYLTMLQLQETVGRKRDFGWWGADWFLLED